MITSDLDMRVHHLWNLRCGHRNNYVEHQNALRLIKATRDGVRKKAYSDEDALHIPSIFRYIASLPKKIITITMDYDCICRLCSNYDGSKCTLHSEENLIFEDQRALKDIFPFLFGRRFVSVETVLKHPIRIKYPDYPRIYTLLFPEEKKYGICSNFS